MRLKRPPALSTCAIGSVPHAQMELALQFQRSFNVPTLPQQPRRDAAEYMLPQALEGLPGLTWCEDGQTSVDLATWEAGQKAFEERLEDTFRNSDRDAFEPSTHTTRAWLPFLWEVENRRSAFAKVQIAGPFTASLATTLNDGKPLANHPRASSQATRLILARAVAMVRSVKATGAVPLITLDEPGLCVFNRLRPAHVVALQELGFAARALSREGALVGLHCCGNTDWAGVLQLPFDMLSVDTRLSLEPLLSTGRVLDEYLARGGWLALGIIPTSMPDSRSVQQRVDDTLAKMGKRRASILARSMLSPACGLALLTIKEAEQVLEDLRAAQTLIQDATR